MLSFFLPRTCIHCNAPCGKDDKADNELKNYLCKNCFRQFQALLQPSPEDLDSKRYAFFGIADIDIYAPYPFTADGIVQSVIHHFKYEDMPKLATVIGKELVTRLPEMEYDVMVPIPLHGTRLGERGYNQSEKLAEGITSLLKLPVAKKHLVKRTRQTPSQTGLTLEERQKNMEGAFALTQKGKEALRGKRILIVDDVMTTGATMSSAAEAIVEAEPARIGVLSFATVVNTTPFVSDNF